MFKTIPGPERVQLGFKEEVIINFKYLIKDYGFQCVRTKVTIVRYESQRVFVNIYHGRSSYALGVEIGLLPLAAVKESRVTLSEILELAGANKENSFFQVSTKEGVKKYVSKLAELVKRYAAQALKGDDSTFGNLYKIQKIQSDRYLRNIELSRIRQKAQEAWHAKNYIKLIGLYESIKNDLTPSERKKLEYASKKTIDYRP